MAQGENGFFFIAIREDGEWKEICVRWARADIDVFMPTVIQAYTDTPIIMGFLPAAALEQVDGIWIEDEELLLHHAIYVLNMGNF